MRPHRAEHTFKRENALEPEGASSKKITIHTRDVFHFDDKIDLLFEDKNNRKQKLFVAKIITDMFFFLHKLVTRAFIVFSASSSLLIATDQNDLIFSRALISTDPIACCFFRFSAGSQKLLKLCSTCSDSHPFDQLTHGENKSLPYFFHFL